MPASIHDAQDNRVQNYLPFGELNSTDTNITSHKFTGDERDSESNLDHTLFRQYSSSLARWMHPDPAGLAAVDPSNPQSWNRYAYVMNDPLDWVDPSGLDPCPNDQSQSAQLCRQAQAFRSTTNYNTWNQLIIPLRVADFDPDVCIPNPSLCTTSTSFIGLANDRGNSSNTSGCGGLLGGCTTTIGADPNHNYKKDYCSHQADLAALENLLPGITRGDYVSTATKISVDTGAHLALEAAAASSVFKRAIRARTGVAMSTAGKLFERAAILLLFVSGEEALRAAQNEYQACINY